MSDGPSASGRSNEWRCPTCHDKGTVLVNLRRFKMGAGFQAWMTAGCHVLRCEDGSQFHEIVCPQCDGHCRKLTPPATDPEG
jgi:hypothetical protein